LLFFGVDAGWRDFGFDRENYAEMYRLVVSSEEFASKYFFVKDTIFLFVFEVVNWLSNDEK
jgi:hypothetical protein